MGVRIIKLSQRRLLTLTERAHRVTVDAFRVNLSAASAFDGVIKAEEDDTPGDEHGH
jgi:hypothetical protein